MGFIVDETTKSGVILLHSILSSVIIVYKIGEPVRMMQSLDRVSPGR